jgi:hypothetical protein
MSIDPINVIMAIIDVIIARNTAIDSLSIYSSL